MRLYCRTLEGRQDPADASRRQLGSQTETRITEGTASALYTYSKMCVCVCGCKIVHMRVQIHSPTDKITLRLHSSRVNSYSLQLLPPVSPLCTTLQLLLLHTRPSLPLAAPPLPSSAQPLLSRLRLVILLPSLHIRTNSLFFSGTADPLILEAAARGRRVDGTKVYPPRSLSLFVLRQRRGELDVRSRQISLLKASSLPTVASRKAPV